MTNAITSFIPLASVRSVPASAEFYRRLGFEIENTFTPDGQTEPSWASLASGRARLMLARSSEPAGLAAPPSVLFYAYCEDVAALRARLLSEGMEAGPIQFPFYAPRGEFRIQDPDGFTIMVTHT